MANSNDIDRWRKGKDHWNSWALRLLDKKAKLEDEGKWSADETWQGNGLNKTTRNWIKSASVDFTSYNFENDVDFSQFLFPYNTDFKNTTFKGNACFRRSIFFGFARFGESEIEKYLDFDRAIFKKYTNFEGAIFRSSAEFIDVEFCGLTVFDNATFAKHGDFFRAKFQDFASFYDVRFNGEAEFSRAEFNDIAGFVGCTFVSNCSFAETLFNSSTDFLNARFLGEVSFNNATSAGFFSISGAIFSSLPDFIQMRFREPPRLDDLRVATARPFLLRGTRERAARYRALKKIADEAHDHVRELDFFANETRERRGNDDALGSGRWLLGLGYELLSDFGRSIARPLVALAATILCFAAAYGSGVTDTQRVSCGWSNWFAPELYLSLVQSLPVFGISRVGKRDEALQCLFGAASANGPDTKITPAMDLLFIGQNIWSAVLIFLLLLAIRNHFRIK